MAWKASIATALLAASFATWAEPPGTAIVIEAGDKAKELKPLVASSRSQVVSKTYVLKNADPYELRPILLSAVRGGAMRGAATGVECVKYSDGRGALVVSAEEYRFGKQPGGGMGVDELVESLDQPDASSAPSPDEFKLILPQNIDAAKMLRNSGLARDHDPYELDAGGGKVMVDPGLNGVLVRTSPSNMKSVDAAMKAYDKPVPEVFVKISVYELEDFTDEELGLDYERWKAKRGLDFAAAGFGGSLPGIDEAHTRYLGFNVKISSDYLDYLREEGKAAKVQSVGRLAMSGKPLTMEIDSNDSHLDDSGVLRTGLDTGLRLKALPLVGDKGATVEVHIKLLGLLGFDKDRKPVLDEKSFDSVLAIEADGSRYVIGGLERRARVKTFNGAVEPLSRVAGKVADGIRSTKTLVLIECVPAGTPKLPETKKAGESGEPSRP